jgi:hypothetical protein
MPWKFEIYLAFFIAFGATQIISNLIYLSKKNGIELARRQHKELPDMATSMQVKKKVVCMLLFGILFLAVGLVSSFTRSFHQISIVIVLGMYVAYALAEAIYYKFWKTIGALILSGVLLVIFILW